MVELPAEQHPTIDAIYDHYVKTNGDFRRDHLGASIIGKECRRAIWYNFRWAAKPNFEGRMLRLFETGHKQEARLIANLKDIGLTVYDRDPDSGGQIHYEEFGGHFSGSLDAVAKGFPEAPVAWHCVECKTMNTKTFAQLRLHGVEKVKGVHLAQMQVYMGWSGIDRAFYLVVCKENDQIYQERVYFDNEHFQRLRQKAKDIILFEKPPFKISDSTKNFKCKYCDYQDICFGDSLPEINCRTCAFSSPIENGMWRCGKFKKELSPLDQRGIHDCHIFVPSLVPLEQTDANPDLGQIMYGEIVNGPGATASVDMWKEIERVKGVKGK